MAKDLIRYDLLVQDALKGVVRRVLGDAIRDGLPGDHHFYVSFRTDHPGVRVSPRLREKYPEDMTIVLQHQFWDLAITEHMLEVGLSFSGVPERLSIPFDALTGFFDPSVQFGLKFEVGDKESETGSDEAAAKNPPAKAIELQPKRPSVPTAARPSVPRLPAKAAKPAAEPEKSPAKADKGLKIAKPAPAKDKADETAGAEVVSLDAFRKKN